MKRFLVIIFLAAFAASMAPAISEAAHTHSEFEIITNSLPAGTAGVYYEANVHVLYSGSYVPSAHFTGLPPGIAGGGAGIAPIGGALDLPLSGVPAAGGVYNVSLFLQDTFSSASKNFSLTISPVYPPPLPAQFALSPNSFDFYYTIGGSVPENQVLTFTQYSGGTVYYTISLDSHPSWLNSSYSENISLPAYSGQPTGVGASVNPAGLSAGTYRANIHLSGNFSGSPVIIPIRLTVAGVLGTTTPPAPPNPIMRSFTIPLIRLYHRGIDDHFYTTDRAEALSAINAGYVHEEDMGYVYYGSQAGTEPLYRMYSSRLGNHFYTSKAAEVLAAQRVGFTLEGIIGYVASASSPGDKQIYRLYNRFSGDHVYTTDSFERQILIQRGYTDEGSLGWLVTTP